MNAAANAGRRTANEATYLIREIMDGCRIKLVRDPKGKSLIDFLTGKTTECSLELKIEVKEEGE